MTIGPELKTPLPGPKAKAIIDRDEKVITQAYTRGYPLVMERGEGVYCWDVDGNKFIDFVAGIAVNALGHSHPDLVKAISDQAGKFIHMAGTDFYYEIMTQYVEKLIAKTPVRGTDKHAFLCNSGAEAIEAAIKLVRWHTRRPRLMAFYNCFHGRTMGALSLSTSKAIHRERFGPFLDASHAPFGDIEFIRRNLFKRAAPPENVAAIFVEPIQGEGGYIVSPNGFLKELRELCDEYNILMVADEIQTGFGRTGKMFCVEHWDVEPDIICMAKPIGGGVPLGAIVARKEIMGWPSGAHANTFGGNPLACAAGLVVLDHLEKGLLDNVRARGEQFEQRLTDISGRFDFLTEVTGLGLMRGIRVVDAAGKPDTARRNKIVDLAFERGLLILGAGEHTVRFLPPLTVNEKELDAALDVFEAAVKSS